MRQKHGNNKRNQEENGVRNVKNHILGIGMKFFDAKHKPQTQKLLFAFGVTVLVLVLLFQLQALPWVVNTLQEARVSLIRLEFPEKEDFLILEVPPSEGGLDASTSQEIFAIIGLTIFSQNVSEIIPTLIDYYRVKYAVFYDTPYKSLFEPFLKREGDVDNLVQIAQIDPKKVSGNKKQPFLALGEGWYAYEQEEGGSYRWIEQSAVIKAYIPKGKDEEARASILKFSTKHFPSEGAIDVFLNDEYISTLNASSAYSDMYVELKNIKEGENRITFTAKDTCRIASSQDKRCVSFALKDIGLLEESQIPTEGITRYNGFFPEEEEQEAGVSVKWMSTKAGMQFFTLQPQRIFVSFEATSYAKNRTFNIEIDGEKLQAYILPDGPDFTNIGFPLELKRGNVRVDFIAEGCDKPALLEHNEDQRCLSVQIKDFQYRVLQ